MDSKKLEEIVRDRVLVEWDVITESDWFKELVRELVRETLSEEKKCSL